jgi:hypothetical protein
MKVWEFITYSAENIKIENTSAEHAGTKLDSE